MIEAAEPNSIADEMRAANEAKANARRKAEARLEELEQERTELRQLLGRVRKPKAATTKPAKKRAKKTADGEAAPE